MHRSITTVIGLVAALASASCEDGPSQTFTALPPGAGSVINGPGNGPVLPDSGLFVSPAQQGYDASVGGQNASQLCTAAQQKQVWNNNLNAPIIVPGLAGGLDIAGGAPGTQGVAGFDPQCLTYQNCLGSPINPTYNAAGTAPYWSNPLYDPTKETWTGMTVEKAETLLCQPENDTAIFGGDYPQLNWGEQGEFGVLYNTNNRLLTAFIISQGYAGLLKATNKTTNTTYTISMQNVFMTKQVGNGTPTPIVLDWSDNNGLVAIINELYEAMRQTFIGADSVPEADCTASGHCQLNNNGIDDGILIFSPLNFAIFVDTTIGTPSAVSIPFLLQIGVLKLLPFSSSSCTLQLDSAGVGPTAITTGLGGVGSTPGNVTCDYHLGMLYGDPKNPQPGTFQHDCIEPIPGGPTQTQNAINEAKILGALAHGDENYQFSTQGVDPEFAATSLAPTTVIADGQTPAPTDVAYELTVDANLLGTIANDFTNNDSTQPKDWHGTGLVMLEWAQIVQTYMQNNYGVTASLGDPDCIANPVRPPLPDGGVYAPGTKICSGLEGIVTTAPPSLVPASMAVNALGPAGVSVDQGAPNCNATQVQTSTAGCGPAAQNTLKVGLLPSTWYSIFCTDGAGLDHTGTPSGYTNCLGNGANGSFMFDTMQDAVAVSYGVLPQQAIPYLPGNIVPQTIPEELTNRRFFFEQWILAMVKYLHVADVPTTPLIAATSGSPSIDGVVVNPNALLFDNYGGNGSGFEFAQYDDTTNVDSANQAPTAFSVVTNLLTGSIGQFTFDRYNFRGDTAIFKAMSDKTSDKPGAETAYLQNLAGSPVLQNVYGPGSAGYACATAITAAEVTAGGCSGPAPLDEFGNALYLPYADAFGTTIFNIPANQSPQENQPSGITIDPGPYENIQSAMVTLPIITPPSTYCAAGPQNGVCPLPAGTATVQELLPFLQGATVGFPVTIDGSRDKFYNTLNVDFSAGSVNGQTVNFNMDYEYVPAGSTNLIVRALESQNYFGEIFVCSEPSPTVPGATDILGIRMYDNGATILNWLSAHPTATVDCGVQIKFSIYGNYADYISFGVSPGESIAGARIGLNPGFGGSVVSDGTIFDPNIVSSLGL